MPSSITRRGFVRAGIISAASAGASLAASAEAQTPPQVKGPFYPIAPQDEKDADLTRFGEAGGRAEGAVIVVAGRVLDMEGAPVGDAVVDIWQANTHGRYAHERDPSVAPLDPNFQGWAILTTDAEGRYRFKTVIPGPYPAAPGWDRPPHVHFKVGRRGFREIVTQMYFEGQPLNAPDRLLNSVPEAARASLIAKPERLAGDPDTQTLYRFDIVLAGV